MAYPYGFLRTVTERRAIASRKLDEGVDSGTELGHYEIRRKGL